MMTIKSLLFLPYSILPLIIFTNVSYSMQQAIEPQPATEAKVTIGVDVGGTNTDAVLLIDDKLITKSKMTTTQDITTGIVHAIAELFKNNQHLKEQVKSINIGTTHLLNALLQRKGLTKPLIVRLASPYTTSTPPTIDWATDLKKELLENSAHILDGGYEFNGTEISPLNKKLLYQLAKATLDQKIESIAITGVFSNVNPSQEEEARSIFKHINPNVDVSLSHTLGELGLLARENATILNACLTQQYQLISHALKEALGHLGMKARVFLTYGDGTKTNLEDDSATPLRTLNSGPMNSLKGAAILANVKDAVTVDIGGTSSDIGILKNGEPVNENSHFSIGGITCNFTSPRFNSLALGGGSIIKSDKNGTISIGPESVGKELSKRALVYDGDTLTVTDIAVVLGRLNIGVLNKDLLKKKISLFALGEDTDIFIKKVDHAVHEKLALGIQKIIDSIEEVPSTLVLIGGGALLLNLDYLKNLLPYTFASILIPESADVANALGAAMSLIGGRYVHVYDYTKIARTDALFDASAKAKKLAIEKGANGNTLKVSSISEIPLTYLPGDPNQLTVNVVGNDTGDYRSLEKAHSQTLSIENQGPSNFSVSVSPEDITDGIESLEAPINSIRMQNLRSLTESDVNDIARGAGLLGSGGGGSPDLGRYMALYALKRGKNIQIISFEDLPDDAFVVVFGGMGSPTVAFERLPSLIEGIGAIREIEKKTGKSVDALVVMEAGGANATYPLFVAAELNIPVVDCDCMGRAFPGINMVTPCIYGTFNEHYAALASGRKSEFIQVNEDFSALENKARVSTVAMGGCASTAFLPMTGAQVKQWTIKGTLSLTQAIGKALRESEGEPFNRRLDILNEVLATTDYKKAKKIAEGKIVNLRRKEVNGFSIGGFLVENQATKEQVKIGFQNENLIAFKKTGEILAEVPNLIITVDKNTFLPISCEELRYGQDIVMLTMTIPMMMATEKALKVVGPKAYPMEQIFNLING